MTFERQRQFRAILTCTTCEIVVAVGPLANDAAMACYWLGGTAGELGRHHLGTCAGGALTCTPEEIPPPPPSLPPPAGPPTLRSVA